MNQSLIGVIDLRGGLAVHAVAGDRDRYQVIDRPWCIGGDPVQLARFYQRRGVAGVYVADLDAIVDGSDRSVSSVEQILSLGLLTWVDAGMAAVGCETEGTSVWLGVASRWPHRVVVGTESLREIGQVAELSRFLRATRPPQPASPAKLAQPAGRLTISLDVRGESVLSPSPDVRRMAPIQVAAALIEAGADELIVLDVGAVGTGCGPTTGPLCEELSQRFSSVRLISGGGIRDAADVRELLRCGCDAVLTATWLQEIGQPSHGGQRND